MKTSSFGRIRHNFVRFTVPALIATGLLACASAQASTVNTAKGLFPNAVLAALPLDDAWIMAGAPALNAPLDLDTDGDGLADWQETMGFFGYVTDPFNPDTDGDGLWDGEEEVFATSGYFTNPTKDDTDGDVLMDGEEVFGTAGYLTDPTKADTDGEGLTDGAEVLGTYGYYTDPTTKDTDGDKLADSDEELVYLTDPTNPDTDSDWLTDGNEILVYSTDPKNPDTDGDHMLDGAEIIAWTDPLDPKSFLGVTSMQRLATGRLVLFAGASTHCTYSLQCATNLTGGTWTDMTPPTPCLTNGTMSLNDTNAYTAVYYRVAVQSSN